MINKFVKATLSAATVAAICTTTIAVAQEEQQGSTSYSESDITFTVDDQVQLTGLSDIDLGTYSATDTGEVTGGDTFCVYVNGADDFTITASNTANDASDFTLDEEGDGTDQIQYTVRVANGDVATAAATAALGYDSASGNLTGSNQRNCGGSDNTAVEISVDEQEMREATTGDYAGTLQLLVTPS